MLKYLWKHQISTPDLYDGWYWEYNVEGGSSVEIQPGLAVAPNDFHVMTLWGAVWNAFTVSAKFQADQSNSWFKLKSSWPPVWNSSSEGTRIDWVGELNRHFLLGERSRSLYFPFWIYFAANWKDLISVSVSKAPFTVTEIPAKKQSSPNTESALSHLHADSLIQVVLYSVVQHIKGFRERQTTNSGSSTTAIKI